MAAGDSVISRLVSPFMRCTKKSLTIDGSATQDIFTVTGVVEIRIVGVCTTNVTNHGDSISVGDATTPQLFIANTVASSIDAGEIWVDSSPSAQTETIPTSILYANQTVILTGSANVTAGVVDFYAFWMPVSSNAVVSAA